LASSPPSQNRRISRHGPLLRPSLMPNHAPSHAMSRTAAAGTGHGGGGGGSHGRKRDARGDRTRRTPPAGTASPNTSAGPRLRPKLRDRAPSWGCTAGWSCEAELSSAGHSARSAPAAARPPAPRGAPRRRAPFTDNAYRRLALLGRALAAARQLLRTCNDSSKIGLVPLALSSPLRLIAIAGHPLAWSSRYRASS
jgi:hypothetical protein